MQPMTPMAQHRPSRAHLRALAVVDDDALTLPAHVDDHGAAAVDVHGLVLVSHLFVYE